jgi:hypothetical protein
MVPPALCVFAVDDPRLVRVKPESHLLHPLGDCGKHGFGLPPGRTVHDSVIGVALERAGRELLGQPVVERKVHEQVRQDRRDRRSL